jgi:predicted heme/steroid binding protein/uncharacterized membrane protein
MDKEELGRANGEGGAAAYVAYKGKVYDASSSKLWKGGLHMGSHRAGMDLTDFISLAPHTDSVLDRLAVVGRLAGADGGAALGGNAADGNAADGIAADGNAAGSSAADGIANGRIAAGGSANGGSAVDGVSPADISSDDLDSDPRQRLREFYRKYHPHPVLLHYPVGAFAFAALMQALFILTRDASFELSAFYSLVFGFVTTFPTIFSGLFSWHVNYEDTFTPIFTAKIISSAVLVLTGGVCVVVRFLHPDVSGAGGAMTALYDALVFLNVPVIGIAAYNGGKITWPS